MENISGTLLQPQLEQLFIFNYLLSNFDFHGENFGFLYDTETFEITGVAPAYDFNSAYDVYGDVSAYDSDIFTRLPQFMNNNKHLVQNLQRTKSFLETDRCLSKEQKQEIVSRAEYLVSLVHEEVD